MHPQAKTLLADKATPQGLRSAIMMAAMILGVPIGG